MFYWKRDINKNILRLKTLKKNIEPHQKFTGSYKKRGRGTGWNSKCVGCQ